MPKRVLEPCIPKRELRSRTKAELSQKVGYAEVHQEGEVAYFAWYYPERETVDGMVKMYGVDELEKPFNAFVAQQNMKPSKYGFIEGRDSSMLDCDIARALRNWTQVPYSDDPTRTYKAAVIRSDEKKATVITRNGKDKLQINTYTTPREVFPKGYEGGKWKAKYGKCKFKVEMNELLASVMEGKEGTMVVLDDQHLRTTRAVAAKNKALRFIVPNPAFERLKPAKVPGVDVECVASDLEELLESETGDEIQGTHAYLDLTRERGYAIPLFQKVCASLVRGQVVAGTFCVRHLTGKEVDDLPRWLSAELSVPHLELKLVHSRAYRNGGRMFSFIMEAQIQSNNRL